LPSGIDPLRVPEGYALHEERPHAARSLVRRRAPIHPDAVLPVKIGLTQSNLDHAYSRLMNVSHPSSPGYGKHLSVNQVNYLFAPSDDSVTVVREWLAEIADIDIDRILVSNNGWIAVDLPLQSAERAFSTHYYEHEDRNGDLGIGCDSCHLPSHIQPHIDYVTPGVKSSPRLKKRTESGSRPLWGGGPERRPQHWDPHQPGPWHMPPAARTLPADLQDCARNIMPTCIRALYDIPKAHLNDSVNSLGILEDGDFVSSE